MKIQKNVVGCWVMMACWVMGVEGLELINT